MNGLHGGVAVPCDIIAAGGNGRKNVMQSEHSKIEDGPEDDCRCRCDDCSAGVHEECGWNCEEDEDDYDDSDEARWEDQDRGRQGGTQ